MLATAALMEFLLTLLDEAYNKKSWHGPNLRGALRGVAAREAAWRPRPGAHNIWEIAVHAAYWKYVVWRRITGSSRGTFALQGSNFFSRPEELSEPAWKRDLEILESAHRDLRMTVAKLDPGIPEKLLHMIRGAASHDVYHAGQIRLLRRLYGEEEH
jgi:DinB superfamily